CHRKLGNKWQVAGEDQNYGAVASPSKIALNADPIDDATLSKATSLPTTFRPALAPSPADSSPWWHIYCTSSVQSEGRSAGSEVSDRVAPTRLKPRRHRNIGP